MTIIIFANNINLQKVNYCRQ